jgi:hypothetical protein
MLLFEDRPHPNYFFASVVAVKYGLLNLSTMLAGIGLVGGFVGRCLCLRVPAVVVGALARVRLAVVFELCSLLSFGVFFVLRIWLRLPPIFEATPMLFSLLTAYIARIQFLRFTHTLAEHVDPKRLPNVTAVQRLYLYVPGAFFMAFGVYAVGNLFATGMNDEVIRAYGAIASWLIVSAALIAGVIAVWRCSMMLHGLRNATTAEDAAQLTGHPDDPDAEYRRRYTAAEGAT